MKLWRESTDTTWYVIGCDDCPDWQSMALSKDHEVLLAAEHETAIHPESRTYRANVTKRFPERARLYQRKSAGGVGGASSGDLIVMTEAGAKRRRELVDQWKRAKSRREQVPRCVDCGVEVPLRGGRWTPALRCPEHAAEHKRAQKRAYYARNAERINSAAREKRAA